MAKLVDLSTIYGHSNKDIITKIICNVFENDKRYVADFQDSLNIVLGYFRKVF